MTPCPYCVEKHIGKAKVYFGEAVAGHPGRIGMALGELAAAEEEAPPGALQKQIRSLRKQLEVRRTEATIPWEDLLARVEAAVLATKQAPKRAAGDGDCAPCAKKRQAAAAAIAAPPPPPPPQRPREEAEPAVAADHQEDRPELILLTALSDFAPSYSLASVIIDQARAAADAGMAVTIIGMENLTKRRPEALPADVRLLGALPNIGWREDELDDAKVEKLRLAILGALAGRQAAVVTHDLLFQSWYLNAAKAIHLLAGDHTLTGIRWHHQVHSSVGARPAETIARWRARIPAGHRMVAVNWSDIPHLAAYYGNDPADWITLPNTCDPLTLTPLGPVAAQLAPWMAEGDVVQTYPLSTPRAASKGLQKVIETFGVLKARGLSVRLVVANAHANGPDARQVMTEMANLARAIGIGDELRWTSLIPSANKAAGLPRQEVLELLRLSNVFVFPSVSESCGLVALEAAAVGNLLVLNQNLPVLTDYFPPTAATYVPFGSLREQVSAAGYQKAIEQAATAIEQALTSNPLLVARQRLRKICSLGGLGARLRAL